MLACERFPEIRAASAQSFDPPNERSGWLRSSTACAGGEEDLGAWPKPRPRSAGDTIALMCRMIAAPMGLPGRVLLDPFVRMAQGRNALNEHNTAPGVWRHPHGWGAVFEDDGDDRLRRSVEVCWEDAALGSLADRRLYLLHARRASRGKVTLKNTHPFEASARGDRWFFCHNGTVRDLSSGGRSDSQEVFDRLLPYVTEDRILNGFREVYGEFDDFTGLNSFLFGPNELWVVCSYTKNPNYYTLILSDGPIVSSEPLHEFASSRRALPNGAVLRIDRASGEVEWHTLD